MRPACETERAWAGQTTKPPKRSAFVVWTRSSRPPSQVHSPTRLDSQGEDTRAFHAYAEVEVHVALRRRMTALPLEPLTRHAFAPFGDVLSAEADIPAKPANQGTARRFDRLCRLDNQRPLSASLNLCMFHCDPRPSGRFAVDLLEKHPRSSQMFIPMNASRYVVIVALARRDEPDVNTVRAFLASGAQGISYNPGVWHHPLIALDRETLFACAVYEDESDEDCIVHSIAQEQLYIELPRSM
jgi:ureidoglycolate lyase